MRDFAPGSVHPALQRLEDEGLPVGEERGGGRAYRLTERGRAHLSERAQPCSGDPQIHLHDSGGGRMSAVTVKGLKKTYGKVEAVKGVDFEGAAGRGLRLPRTERRRQDHDDQHAVHAGQPHGW
ncbi:hypothetical protein [Nonomuraea dietziae]|uniref:PadR family transcriptional regulator n=1 Tax=Nonomuraea dietziae TaxID=65515 RepID=UPI0031D904DA